MSKFKMWQRMAFCSSALLAYTPLQAQEAAKWGPHIDLEAKPGSKRTLGEVDFFMPVHQDSDTLVFANVRTRFDDESSREGNFGLGVRQMQASGWNLGAYGYFDRRRTTNDQYFNQATIGLEALGHDFDFRTNAYLPVGTKVRELPEVSTASISGASVLVSSDLREERALKGFDLEAGWRTPLFDSEAARQLRIYAGGYRFSDSVSTVQGPRLRAELALEDLPGLAPGARLYLGAETQHDSQRGTQNFISLRIRIPLGKESSYSNRLTAQERRMTAPVMRDVDIVTQARTRATVVETASTTAGGQTLTAINGTSFAGTDLSAQLATAGANSTVVLSGTFSTSAKSTLQAGQTLTAGTVLVRTPSGRVVPLTTSATINAAISNGNATIEAANNSTISGLVVTNTSVGINAQGVVVPLGVSGVTIANNSITVTGPGGGGLAAVALVGGNSTVSGNTLTAIATTTSTSNLAALFMNGVSATITGNTFSATNVSSGSSRALNLQNNPTINAGSTGNTLLSGSCFLNAGITGSIGLANGATCP